MIKKLLIVSKSILGSILIVSVCLAAFVVLSSRMTGGVPTIFGHQLKAVLSGSMEPAFETGSIIAIQLKEKNATYNEGDVITFLKDGKLITHRIIEAFKQNGQVVYKTKGDNNDGADTWSVSSQEIVGKYTGLNLPYVGYALKFASSKTGSALLLFVPGLLLLLSAFRSIAEAKKELEARTAG